MTLLLLAGATLAAHPSPAQSRPATPAFVGELSEAYERGRVRNAPVVLMLMLDDGAPDSEEFRSGVLFDPRLAEQAAHCVWVVAEPETHEIETVTVERDGDEVEITRCARFQSRTCEEHQRPWTSLYVEFQEADGELFLPQAIVKLPSGKVHKRFNARRAPGASALHKAIAEAREVAGPDISWDDLQRVLQLQREVAKFRASKRHGGVYKSWSAIAKLTKAPPYAGEATAGAEQALAAMRTQLAERAAACGDVEDVVPAYEKLLRLVRDYADTPLQRDLDKAIKSVQKDKRHKQRLRIWKREQEAQAALREVEDAKAAGDTKLAQKLVRKLVRKYDDTEAAQTARFKFKDWL